MLVNSRISSESIHKAMVIGTAGLMLTAGGACGYDCRRGRDQRDRDDMLNQIDEVLTKNIEDCQGDPVCIDAERDMARNRRRQVNEWYVIQVDNNHKESKESRDWLRNFLNDLGKKAAEHFLLQSGTVLGQASIVDVETVAIASSSSSGTGGTQQSSAPINSVVTSVVNTAGQSASGLVPTLISAHLQGSFIIDFIDTSSFDINQFVFNFDFRLGRLRQLNGLNVQEIVSGSSPIQGTDLKLVINSDAGHSEIVLGSGGVGVIRLGGEIVSDNPDAVIPVNNFIKIDLPITQNSDGSFTIETPGIVDFNIMVNGDRSWYADYNHDGVVTPEDRTSFMLDHSNGVLWTDIVGDELFDQMDVDLFDSETSAAIARRNYLVSQGVGNLGENQ